MAGHLVIEMRDGPLGASATQQVQDQRLSRHLVRNQNFPGEAHRRGRSARRTDCNVSLAGVWDQDLIGEAVGLEDLSPRKRRRDGLPIEFMEEHGLMACNTWQNTEHSELMYTREAWSDGQEAQIDFVLASQDWLLHDTWINQHTHAASDHRPVCVGLSTKMQCGTKQNIPKNQRSLKQCQPGNKWTGKIAETLKDADLEDWTSWAKKVRDTAHENRKDTKRSMDPILVSLLAQSKIVSGNDTVERDSLSKRMWRRKRHFKREATGQVIQSAAADGR